MNNTRPLVREGAMVRPARDGDGLMAFFDPQIMNVDAASTITVANMAGGLIIRTTAATNRIDTTPTAAAIIAAYPEMDVGESFIVTISNQTAVTITIAGGAGVTASGNLVIAATSMRLFMFTKTSATTMTLIGL